jgi:glyoxylase-like metal-dependent hydrolase (beta-lactamase superfamily II)
VVAPNAFHGHLAMGDYAAAYPDAELHAGPGLDVRRKDLVFARLLGDAPDPRWAEDLDQATMLGHRLVPEVVFLHRATRSLIVGDIVVNVPAGASRRLTLWLGIASGVGVPRLRRLDTRDKRQARASLDRILAWDFDRIVTGHGEVVETGGPEALRSAYAFLP